MDIVILYGYITMFGCAFPFCTALFFLYVLIEIEIQPWALCNNTRRPYPRLADSIGVWGYIIQALSLIGVATNTAIILFTTNIFEIDNDNNKWLFFFILEHAFIVYKLFLDVVIRDEPSVVTKAQRWGKMIVNKRIVELLQGGENDPKNNLIYIGS
jgi:anoctamin-10